MLWKTAIGAMRSAIRSARLTQFVWALLAMAMVLVPMLVPASAAADATSPSVTLNGYEGIASRTFTTQNAFLFGTIGSYGSPYGPPEPDLFVSAFPFDGSGLWQVTMIPPVGSPLAPGTYANAGGFEAEPGRPVLITNHFGGVLCNGGTFTISGLDTATASFDVSWSQVCNGSPVSGRAVFGALSDTTAPAISVPGPITVDATGMSGATVDFSATASDPDDLVASLSCSRASGSTFPIGTTTVTCTATDTHGNTSSATFTVHVNGAVEQLADLLTAVTGVGPGTSLADKVSQVLTYLNANDTADACSTLTPLINELAAQSGKTISSGQATTLIATAQRIEAVLGC